MSAENIDLVRRFAAAWAERDIEAVMNYFADDAEYRGSVGPEPGQTWTGKDAIRVGITAMFAHDAGAVIERGQVIADGDAVYAEWKYLFADLGVPPAVGCDLFKLRNGRIVLKDAYRKTLADPRLRAVGEPQYRQRRFAMHPKWRLGSAHFKVHLISQRVDREPYVDSAEVVAAAKAQAAHLQEAMAAGGEHFDVGYVVLHEGEMAHWLLFHWWIAGGIACGIISRAALDEPTLFERVNAKPYLGCVWEAIAVEHERRSWVATALSGRPIADYLMHDLQPGLY